MDIAYVRQTLEEIVGPQHVRVGESMIDHTTFDIGGLADVYVIPQSVDQVISIVKTLKALNVELRVIGYGSDLLVCDEGLHCVVMQINKNLSAISCKGTTMHVQAGASNGAVARAALSYELTGYEFASGIPGTIGGAAIMNAGAYGGEFKDVAVSLECVTPDGALVTISRDEANWSYRHSMMDDSGLIVVGATLELRRGQADSIKSRMDELKAMREEKQPLDKPSAGSTFKRPEGYFAGKLIQDAGLRGYQVGGAQVSCKHTGFVINAGNATAHDVLQLIQDVQNRVYEQFGVMLEPEVRMWR